MDEKEIFAAALGLTGTVWEVVEVTLDLTRTPGRLDIRLDFPPGTRFPRASDGQLCTIYDTEEHSWRHMNFFQFERYLHPWVPRTAARPPYRAKTLAAPCPPPPSASTLPL